MGVAQGDSMLTAEEKNIALNHASNGATFMFIPNHHLCSKIVQSAPETQDIAKSKKIALLENKPIRMETETIVKYCRGTLDCKNSWLLDQGDIQVIPHQFETKIKENDNE